MNPVHRAAREFVSGLGFCIMFAALLSLANANSSADFGVLFGVLLVGVVLFGVGA